jgi:class 3 adenylate cyclase
LDRRLAAILAADVVGYARLMGEDETGTLERLKSLRWELAQPKIAGRSDRRVLAKIRQWLAYSRQPFIL